MDTVDLIPDVCLGIANCPKCHLFVTEEVEKPRCIFKIIPALWKDYGMHERLNKIRNDEQIRILKESMKNEKRKS